MALSVGPIVLESSPIFQLCILIAQVLNALMYFLHRAWTLRSFSLLMYSLLTFHFNVLDTVSLKNAEVQSHRALQVFFPPKVLSLHMDFL